LIGTFVVGTEYYWIPLNLPVDAAIINILPSIVVVCSLSYVFLSKTMDCIVNWIYTSMTSVIVASWISLSFAYYLYYKNLLFGYYWYHISTLMIVIMLFAYRIDKKNVLQTLG
jgi:hypothetical protein